MASSYYYYTCTTPWVIRTTKCCCFSLSPFSSRSGQRPDDRYSAFHPLSFCSTQTQRPYMRVNYFCQQNCADFRGSSCLHLFNNKHMQYPHLVNLLFIWTTIFILFNTLCTMYNAKRNGFSPSYAIIPIISPATVVLCFLSSCGEVSKWMLVRAFC